jgi:TrmH family RNA methyltransferase
MSNFGFFSLRLAGAYRDAVEEAKSAVNAEAVLREACEFDDLADAIADCELVVGTTSVGDRQLHHKLATLEAAAPLILATPGPVALVFGSEKYGLSNEAMDHCHWLIRIPSRPEHGSINLGQAVAVTLYELIRDSTATAPTLDHRATQAELQRFEELLFECLNESGYARTPATEGKIRRMVRRLEIPPHDAQVWNGIFRQILWRLRHNREESDPS